MSDRGKVRSLPREVACRGGKTRVSPGRILKPTLGTKGYFAVNLSREGKVTLMLVHRAVLFAFTGPPGEKQETRHLNGVRTDNRWPENLAWDSSSDQEWDKIRHGTHQQASKTHCVNNHEFTPENTEISYNPDGSFHQRHCKECRKVYRQRTKKRKTENPISCKEEDCGKSVFARGWCNTHYRLWSLGNHK